MHPPVHGEMRHNVCPFVRLSVRSFVRSLVTSLENRIFKKTNKPILLRNRRDIPALCREFADYTAEAEVVQGGGKQGDERINFSTKEVIFMQVKTWILGGGIVLDFFGRFFVFKVVFNFVQSEFQTNNRLRLP